jgi:hypothetical protein
MSIGDGSLVLVSVTWVTCSLTLATICPAADKPAVLAGAAGVR